MGLDQREPRAIEMTDKQLAISLIKEEAMSLAVGDTMNMYCPFCEATHEAKLSVTRIEEGLLYNDYRAGCGERGFIPSIPGYNKEVKKKEFKPKKITYPIEELPDEIKWFLVDEYGFTEEEIKINGFRYAPTKERLIMPLFNVLGYEYGYVGKYFGANVETRRKWKAISYFYTETNKLHYAPVRKMDGPVVIVEDILSSIKVARQAKCVALLGHNITEAQAQELAKHNKDIILALDNDVINKAIKLKKKYGFMFRSFKIKFLSADPKSLTDEEIRQEILE